VSHPDVSPCPDEGRNGRAPATLVFPPPRSRSEHDDPPADHEHPRLTGLIGLSCLSAATLLAFIAVVVVLMRR
jgi:hypothetical protein